MRKNFVKVDGQMIGLLEFGELVESKRRKMKMTQQELGEELAHKEGIELKPESCRVTISRIEMGSWRPTEERVNALVEILDLTGKKGEEDISKDDFAAAMTELTAICARLSSSSLQSVISFARQIEEYGL